MKKVVVTFVSAAALATMGMAAASSSMAASSNQSFSNDSVAGITISGNAGYGVVNGYSKPNLGDAFTNGGFSWNGSLGYQFNKYIALESGYTQFANVTAAHAGFSEKLKNYGVDLLVKGILPINSQFSVFAKAGAMYFYTAQSASNFAGHTITFASTTGNATNEKYLPEVGVGSSYDVTPQLAVTLQAIGTFDGDSVNTYAGYTGLTYKFIV